MNEIKITYGMIKSLNPCYEPEEIGIFPDYEVNISEFITEFRDKVKNKENMVWVLCRNEFMDDRELRLFAVWCARQNIDLLDEAHINCINVAEKYANGLCTAEEMHSAWANGWACASASASASAWASARGSAIASAWDSASDSASASARGSARASARGSAIDKQVDYLLELFKGKENE